MDAKFSDMGERELGAKADGKLFGDPFINKLRKHATSFSSLNKSEAAMKRVSQPCIFGGLGDKGGVPAADH